MTDFLSDPLKLWGIWPALPTPVEVSIYGMCDLSCAYCFSNNNRKAKHRQMNPVNPIDKLIPKLSRVIQDEYSPIGYFLRNKYPIVFSNTCDPFMKAEKTHRASEAFLKWASAMNQPLSIQTKVGILEDPEEFKRYSEYIRPQKDTVYITISTLDEDIARRFEPGSPAPSKRLEVAEKFASKGIPVTVGLNPYISAWVPDKAAYCKAVAAAGIRGVWFGYLHFSKAQASVVSDTFKEYVKVANFADDCWPVACQEIMEWYLTCKDHGLLFFPDPYIDARLGYLSPYQECLSPDDFGPDARLFDYSYEFMRTVQDIAHDGDAFEGDLKYRPGQKVLVQWSNIASFLQHAGLENPLLNVDDFWIPYNMKIHSDRHAWNAALGKRAPLYEVLRYFWNNPHENAQFCWDNPLLQVMKDLDTNEWITDEEHNLLAVYNPEFRTSYAIPEAYDVKEFWKRQDEFILIGDEEETTD
jgi:DNA repair photolyase